MKLKREKYTTPELGRSFLIQRLEKPWKTNALGMADNPFAFGGGYKNGGLSDDAMNLLRDIFRFDYMGAAEFEFGAVPKALQKVANTASHDDLVGFSFEIPLADVEPHWKDKDAVAEGNGTIYVICPEDWAEEVANRIRYYAAHPFGGKVEYRLLEMTMLHHALRPRDEWDTRRCGWLELDNGYFFFTDKDMFEQVCQLFGVKPQ